MSTKVITDPSALGWEQDGATANGTPIYKWAEGADNEHPIVDGDTEGQVTTWDGAKWTPDSSLTIDASGNATFSGDLMITGNNIIQDTPDGRITIDRDAGRNRFMSTTTGFGAYQNLEFRASEFNFRLGAAAPCFSLNTSGNATFTGGSFSPSVNGGWVKAAVATSGSFGGGIALIDGSAGFGMWAQSSGTELVIGHGSTSGALSSDLTIDASGNATFSGTVNALDHVATSDERLKDNITTAPVGLIDSLKGREWDWKESGEKGSGVVAQELEEVLPHLVHTDDEGMKSVAYNGLIAYLIEEVKALKAEIKEMKS